MSASFPFLNLRRTALSLSAGLVLAAMPAVAAPPAEKPPVRDASLDQLRDRLMERVSAVQARTPVLQVSVKADAHALVEKAAPHGERVTKKAGKAEKADKPDKADKADKSIPTGHEHAHWGYAGEGGPTAWGDMDASYATCSVGKRQSPIDIREGIKVELAPIRFDYRATGFRVIDNGHTVQVNLAAGNSIEVGGRRYDLVQFHFHRPSEERINGRQYDMVAHLVHKDPDGRLAVVAVLLEQGRLHPAVQLVWNNLPLERGEENPAAQLLDLSALLPEDQRYYTYMGSLTTPPCTEGVLWMVMKQPAQVSSDQVAIFSRLYPMNARPIQSASGRLIKESN